MREGLVLSTVSLPALVAPPAPRTGGGEEEFVAAMMRMPVLLLSLLLPSARPAPDEWQLNALGGVKWLPSSGGASHRSPDVLGAVELKETLLPPPDERFGKSYSAPSGKCPKTTADEGGEAAETPRHEEVEEEAKEDPVNVLEELEVRAKLQARSSLGPSEFKQEGSKTRRPHSPPWSAGGSQCPVCQMSCSDAV